MRARIFTGKVVADLELPHFRGLYHKGKRPSDKQIDQLVCELYGLTDKEIKIVEEATG